MPLPIDFEKKVRLPADPKHAGYPYRISARDLMLNFNWAALQVGESEVEGIELVEDISDNRRTLRLTGSAARSLPFSISVSNGLTVVQGGWYQVGADSEFIAVDPPTPVVGQYVYAIIEITDATTLACTMSLEITDTAYDETFVISEVAPYNVTEARVQIGYVSGSGVVTQYRHGNFTLGIWQIDGNVTRWP